MSQDLIHQLRRRRSQDSLWTTLYKKLRPKVYFAAYRRLRGNLSMAEDVTHEAFLRFIRYADLDALKDEAHALAYLRQIARRLCWDRLRADRHIVSLESNEGHRAIASWTADEDERQALQSDVQLLAKSLSLPDRSLLSALLNGLSTPEIASILNISYGSAAVRISRLRRKLVGKSVGWAKASNKDSD